MLPAKKVQSVSDLDKQPISSHNPDKTLNEQPV